MARGAARDAANSRLGVECQALRRVDRNVVLLGAELLAALAVGVQAWSGMPSHPEHVGMFFLINNLVTIVLMDVSRRMLKCQAIWRRYGYITYTFLMHYLMYQSLTAPRARRILELFSIHTGSGPEAIDDDEAYGIVWCICGILGYYFASLDTSIPLFIAVILTGPLLWLSEVLLLGSTVGTMKLGGSGCVYLIVCCTVFAGTRQVEEAKRVSFQQMSHVPNWEIGQMRAWQNGLQRILARHFDASDVVGLNLVIGKNSKLRAVLGLKPDGDEHISSFGHSPKDREQLETFFTRFQNLIREEPGAFHGPDKVRAALAVGDHHDDFEVESIWMPSDPQEGITTSQPLGILWIGLLRFRIPGWKIDTPEMEQGNCEEWDTVVDLNLPVDFSECSSMTSHHESASTNEESLPTTTHTGHVFAEMHRISYSEDDCKAELQEKLKKVVEIGEAECWLFGTNDLELVPERVLGFGSYGVVVAAKLHGAEVAVKLPRSQDAGGSIRHMISMANELRILRKVRHPTVVTFHGACIDASSCELCLVSELVAGTQMDKFVLPPPMPPGEGGRHKMIYDVACALRYLHAQDPPIIHGDIKPANVMVERLVNGLRAKILDFGLSRVQTKHAMPLGGTLQWKAPEVVLNMQSIPSPSADVFSFGLLAYFSVTGMKPFPGLSQSTVRQLRKKGQNMPRVWPMEVALIEPCKAMCSMCVRQEPGARPSMQQLHGNISSWYPLPGSSIGPGGSAHSRKPSWDEQVCQLRSMLNGQVPKNRAACTDQLMAQQQCNLYPACKETPAVSKRLSLRSLLTQWNVPFPDDCCCSFHAVLHDCLLVLQELQMECCNGNGHALTGSQCPRCGLIGAHKGLAECRVCNWMASVNPQYAANAPQTLPQLAGEHAVMTL